MALKKFDQNLLTRIFRKIRQNYATEIELEAANQKIDDIISIGGEPNMIDTIKQNGVDLEIINKTVDVIVPTKVSELENDAGYIDADSLNTSNPNLLRGTNSCTELGSYTASDMTWETGKWRGYSYTAKATSIEINDSPNGDIDVGWDIVASTISTLSGIVQSDIPLDSEKTYTVSCLCRGEGTARVGFLINGGFEAGFFEISDKDNWVKLTMEVTSRAVFPFTVLFGCESGEIEICGMKVEEGSIATAWCPSYWDMENKNVETENLTLSFDSDTKSIVFKRVVGGVTLHLRYDSDTKSFIFSSE